MGSLFFRQFAALFWKNWIVLSKHKLVSMTMAAFVLLPF
jgi:ATP-binding cassette subfamily A (ABC1) protein 3